MDLTSLLLYIIRQLDGERTMYAGFHLLRGKRSGQTLQDVEYYQLKPFFGILPKLHIEQFDKAAKVLKNNKFVTIDDHAFVHMTKQGLMAANDLPKFQFNGWDYRGRELLFFARLSLIVQTVSHFKRGEKSFIPTQRDRDIQFFVKKMLYRQPIEDPKFSRTIGQEIVLAMERSGMVEKQKIIFTHRLDGFQCTGWTWNQLATEFDEPPFSVYLSFIESLHLMLAAIERSTDMPMLRKMSERIKVATYLTDSSMKTKQLFAQGLSMGEIATSRKLKMSTIEDHFVEMSINEEQFPIEQFVTRSEMEVVKEKVAELGTKRLRLLKDEFSNLSYFQLRLILGVLSRGGGNWTSTKS